MQPKAVVRPRSDTDRPGGGPAERGSRPATLATAAWHQPGRNIGVRSSSARRWLICVVKPAISPEASAPSARIRCISRADTTGRFAYCFAATKPVMNWSIYGMDFTGDHIRIGHLVDLVARFIVLDPCIRKRELQPIINLARHIVFQLEAAICDQLKQVVPIHFGQGSHRFCRTGIHQRVARIDRIHLAPYSLAIDKYVLSWPTRRPLHHRRDPFLAHCSRNSAPYRITNSYSPAPTGGEGSVRSEPITKSSNISAIVV